MWTALDLIVQPADWEVEFPDIAEWDVNSIGDAEGTTPESIRAILERLAAGDIPE